VTVFTSGTIINEKWAPFFANDSPFLIEITLYGATEPVYESVTQVKGSYKRCMDGIDWLEKYKVPFKLKTVILNENKEEFHACKKIALARGQKDFRFDATLHPKLNGSDVPLKHRITPKEVVEIDLNDPERVDALKKQFRRPLKHREPEEIFNFSCGAGKMSFFANPYGKLQVCTIVPAKELQYDWRNGGFFQEAFYEFFPKITNSRPKKAQRCHQCNLWDVCDMCAGWSSTVHGDLETPVDFMCEVKLARYDFMRELTAASL
jgi:radical SAM protein with 4Fe4S-binding SPASM domain